MHLILIFVTIHIMQMNGNHLNNDNFNNRKFQQMLRSFLNENSPHERFKLLDTQESRKSHDHEIVIDNEETPYEASKCLLDCQHDRYPVTCVQRCPY